MHGWNAGNLKEVASGMQLARRGARANYAAIRDAGKPAGARTQHARAPAAAVAPREYKTNRRRAAATKQV
ncbi:hypothetical protein BGLA2_720026 [Burkholderia gladioli]|nr:hypothetical protein BGLA2_720026 [Burkholderia gladioli]